MQILNLQLTNFRNYSNLKLDFNKNLNIIIGNNGMGKTNLIEAIYLLALTKSFRNNQDSILIKDAEKAMKVKCKVETNIGIKDYSIILNEDGKKVYINKTRVTKLSEYISHINVVLFTSNDLKLIKDSPNMRRKLIDMDIAQLNSDYIKNLNIYNKIMKQRNAYLKVLYINKMSSISYLELLTEKLIKYGLEIYEKRKNIIFKINQQLSTQYLNISDNKDLKLKYLSDYDNLDIKELMQKYKKQQERDIILGKTTLGIHKDDFKFYLNDKDLKDFGSEGQQKNAIIAYKFCEIAIFQQQKNENPILILDDLFSELDKEKINNIFKILDLNIQTFITTTDVDVLDHKILKKAKILTIENGMVI